MIFLSLSPRNLTEIFIYFLFLSAVCDIRLRQGPVFIYEPPMKLVFLNSTGAKLDCSAHGIPDPKVEWTREDGSPVTDLPGLLSVYGNGSIIFQKFESERYQQSIHATIYRCSAFNVHGRILSRAVHVRAGL